MEEKFNKQLTKKERKQLHHEEKSNEQGLLKRKKKIKKILKWGIGAIVVIGLIYGLVILARLSKGNKGQIGDSFFDQGRQHIAVGSSHPEYNSNPPTSGWHYAQSADWGVYKNELPDEQLVHNLEHGGIWISYKGIDETAVLALEKISRSESKVILEPRSKNDAPISLVSWGKLQKLEKFDEAAVKNFIITNRNNAPESSVQ